MVNCDRLTPSEFGRAGSQLCLVRIDMALYTVDLEALGFLGR